MVGSEGEIRRSSGRLRKPVSLVQLWLSLTLMLSTHRDLQTVVLCRSQELHRMEIRVRSDFPESTP